jgi:DNA-binding transcriptional regulator YdaS (Cro superfamily)
MRLDEYLKEVGIPITKFARRIGASAATIHNILDSKRDLRLSIAVRIELATKGLVTCKEILPESFIEKTLSHAKDQKNHGDHKEHKKKTQQKNKGAKVRKTERVY